MFSAESLILSLRLAKLSYVLQKLLDKDNLNAAHPLIVDIALVCDFQYSVVLFQQEEPGVAATAVVSHTNGIGKGRASGKLAWIDETVDWV